jgi:predicted Zn-dependent protease
LIAVTAMNAATIERLRALCGGPRDGALLRFSLGNALLANGEAGDAAIELRSAVEFDPAYSAAWKLLGRALVQAGDPVQARSAWSDGIAAAGRAGDMQAQKEMQVFVRRLDRHGGDSARD